MPSHRHGLGERIGTIAAVDPGRRRAEVRLERALDAGERVGLGTGGGSFRAQVRIGGLAVARGEAGQQVTLAEVPPEVRPGDALVRRTVTLGSWLRDALAHARRHGSTPGP